MTPLVSIAIPAYKKKFLADAIQSVLNQSIQDFELIIVNDKSPEDIDSVVEHFNDKRIRYLLMRPIWEEKILPRIGTNVSRMLKENISRYYVTMTSTTSISWNRC